MSTFIRFIANHSIKVSFLVTAVLMIGFSVGFYLYVTGTAADNVVPPVQWINLDNVGESFRNWVWGISFLFGSVFAVVTLINSLRRTNIMQLEREIEREQLNAQTFAKAVELLGSKEGASRLGAIYALESLMRSDFGSPDSDGHLGRQAGETLAAFIRQQRPKKKLINEKDDEKDSEELGEEKAASKEKETESEGAEVAGTRAPEDIEAAANALARSWPAGQRPDAVKDDGIDLAHTDLSGIRFPEGTNLQNFRLIGASLANLSAPSASFERVDLSGASLSEAKVQRASFFESKLHGTDLSGCDVSNASFEEADIDEAIFYKAQLDETDFRLSKRWGRDQFDHSNWGKGTQPLMPADFGALPHSGGGEDKETD